MLQHHGLNQKNINIDSFNIILIFDYVKFSIINIIKRVNMGQYSDNINQGRKRSTVQTSITLPSDIMEKIDILATSLPNKNISKTITFILEKFFDNEDFFSMCLKLTANEMLVPITLYKKIENISEIGFRGQVERGDIRIVNIGITDYVLIDEDSYKNCYLGIAVLKEQQSETTEQLLKLANRVGLIEQSLAPTTLRRGKKTSNNKE